MPALGIARGSDDMHIVQPPTSDIMDVPVPACPVRWVHACAARRKKRGRPYIATGTAGSCTTCNASSVIDVTATTDGTTTAEATQSVTSCHVDVVGSHVVQLPCDDTTTSTTAAPGQRYELSSDDVSEVTNMVKGIAWPSNARRVVNGRGECLGATNDANGGRLGKNTSKRAEFCKAFNRALARALGDTPFHWGSLQVNVDSI